MTFSRNLTLGARALGDGAPCFVAAEIGINHNGDLSLAREMIFAAARAGVDGVKFQNYRTEDFITDRSLMYRYERDGVMHEISQFDLFKQSELDAAALMQLSAWCAEAGVTFFSTPTGPEGLQDLVRAGAPLVKNGSDYLTHVALIAEMARSGLPTVLSTGMAVSEEIDDAVRAYREAGGTKLVLLHCTSAYPTPDDEVNLARIPALAERYGCLIGFSDHTWGVQAAVGAVALGAMFIEKHFTTDKNLPGPDQHFSSDEAELRELVESVRRFEKQRGSVAGGPTKAEAEGRVQFRLSCVAAHDLPAGHVLAESDIAFRRPGDGLPPRDVHTLIGHRLRTAKPRGARLQRGDVE
ncbi:MAG: N-acetylneuraminate synthase family protein [Gemmatimonadaceae bacterium]|nr:N-acetylneuraminate synthase family protein [Gemmatimonadaceae bacterium]